MQSAPVQRLSMPAMVLAVRHGDQTPVTWFPDHGCPSQSTREPICISEQASAICLLRPQSSINIKGITYRIKFITFTLGILLITQGIAPWFIAGGILILSIEPQLQSRIAIVAFIILRQNRVLESPLVLLPSPRMRQVFRLGAVGEEPEQSAIVLVNAVRIDFQVGEFGAGRSSRPITVFEPRLLPFRSIGSCV